MLIISSSSGPASSCTEPVELSAGGGAHLGQQVTNTNNTNLTPSTNVPKEHELKGWNTFRYESFKHTIGPDRQPLLSECIPVQSEMEKQEQIEILLSILLDQSLPPGNMAEPTKNILMKIINSITVNEAGTVREGFSPIFTRGDVASESLFITALDREYKNTGANNNAWVQELKSTLKEIGLPTWENDNKFNALRVEVAKNSLSRLLFAAKSPAFLEAIRNEDTAKVALPDESGKVELPDELADPLNNPHLEQMRPEIEETRRQLRAAEIKKAEDEVAEIENAKTDLLENMKNGNKVTMPDVKKIVHTKTNFSESGKNKLKRELKIIVYVQKAVNDKIAAMIEEETDPLLKNEDALIASSYDIDEVLDSETVLKLKLTTEERKEQYARLKKEQDDTYNNDHGQSPLIRE